MSVVLCIGTSHKEAAIELRERFALSGSMCDLLCERVLANTQISEAATLMTCNRSELYVVVDDAAASRDAVATYAETAGADGSAAETLRVIAGRDAVEHLFRVTAGVESVVVGEVQIQAQIKETLRAAHDRSSSGPVLDRLFRQALETGKRVRTETSVSEGRASVGSIAAHLVAERLGTLCGKSVLVVGAGSMSGLVARNLSARGATQVFVANRNAARAAHLAEQFQGTAVPFDGLETHIASCDVLVSSTAAPHAVLTRERVQQGLALRDERPLVLVDLAVPRDIEPSVAALPGCHLFDIDDLERVVGETVRVRQADLDLATAIVASESSLFAQWHRARAAKPIIVGMRGEAEDIRARELDHFLRRQPQLTEDERQAVDRLTRRIVNKLLHEPTRQLLDEHAAVAMPTTASADSPSLLPT